MNLFNKLSLVYNKLKNQNSTAYYIINGLILTGLISGIIFFFAIYGPYKIGYYWTFYVLQNDMETGCTFQQVNNYTKYNIEKSKWECISFHPRDKSFCHDNNIVECWGIGTILMFGIGFLCLLIYVFVGLSKVMVGCCGEMKTAYDEVSNELNDVVVQKDN